ncbi:MAG TPA: tetratricopeptide repeat protein [Ktedonobacterales bacterium]|nr:tetratricopeptide repeat protein [Ktedonobacterales bacterium]
MAEDPVVEALVIARDEQPPQSAAVLRGLAAAGFGVGDYTPPAAGTEIVPPAPGNRKRAGTYTISMPGTAATLRIAVWRYGGPVTDGMGETALHALARGLSPVEAQTLQTGTLGLELRLSGGAVRPLDALEFTLKVVGVLLGLTDGVCLDPAAQRCFGRAQLAQLTSGDPLMHVTIHDEAWDADSRWLHTHGMQKFGRPELDLVGVPLTLEPEGRALLCDVAVSLAAGALLAAGGELDLGDAGTAMAVAAPTDLDHQAPYGRLRLVESLLPGQASDSERAAQMLARTALAEAARRAQQGDRSRAEQIIERVLAADPDECGALLLQARLRLTAGQPLAAVEIGEYMELRVPDDYRGPLAVGVGLAALGRLREALHALERSLRLNPEAAEAFAARANVYQQLGEQQRAAEDAAHARYLGYRG